MIRVIKLLVFVIGIMNVTNFQAPAFCNGLNCPPFSIISTQDNIEIREYSDSYWVSTKMKNGDEGELRSSGFMTLFNYISGKNEKKQKIAMTAPVLVKVSSKVPFTSDEEVATMSFYMGQDEKSPQPNESNVFLKKLESKKYAVISYSGYSNRYKQEENLRILGNFLTRNGMKFVNDYYFCAGYDSPFKFYYRHNEVWVELL